MENTVSTLEIKLPESLHAKITELAKAEGISVNQFLVVAAERMSALLTEDFLKNEAQKGKREDFESFLNKVPDVEADIHDRF